MFINKNISGLSTNLYAYFQEESGLYKFVNGKETILFSNSIAHQTILEDQGQELEQMSPKIVMLEIKDYLDRLKQRIFEINPEYEQYLKAIAQGKELRTAVIYAHGHEYQGKWVYEGGDDYFYSVEDLIRYQKNSYQLIFLMVCNPENITLPQDISRDTILFYADNNLSMQGLNQGEVNINLLVDGQELDPYVIEAAIEGADEDQEPVKPDVDDIMGKWGF